MLFFVLHTSCFLMQQALQECCPPYKPQSLQIGRRTQKNYPSINHHQCTKVCVVKWKTLVKTTESCSVISKILETSIGTEKQKLTQIIHIVIDVVLFLATNCLPFRGFLENPSTLTMICASNK